MEEQVGSIIKNGFENGIISNPTNIFNFFINLLLTILLSYLTGIVYIKYGKSISNRSNFASNFPLLSMVTMLIIAVVKSSLALSLGLVGALSIVRFRSAIKEPEELIYLFMSIAIGLGLGANQILITFLTIIIFCSFVIIRSNVNKKRVFSYHNLLINYKKTDNFSIEEIFKILSKNGSDINLKRYTENQEIVESFFHLKINSYMNLMTIQRDLTKIYPGISIDFVDSNGI